jgi:hypothetical protein
MLQGWAVLPLLEFSGLFLFLDSLAVQLAQPCRRSVLKAL